MGSLVSSFCCLASRLASRVSRLQMFAAMAAAVMLAAAPAYAEIEGSSENKAANLVVSTKDDKPRSFALTAEYDADTGKYYTEVPVVETNGTVVVTNMVTTTNFVYYFKMTCKRGSKGQDYTVWLENASSDTIRIDTIDPVDPPEDSEAFEPEASFEEVSGNWGTMWFMDKESWSTDDSEDMDPASWVYVIRVEGAEGDTATIHYVQANALPEGIEENPAYMGAIVNETTDEIFPKSGYKTFVTNEYSFWFSADLKSGRRYAFATQGVDPGNTYQLSFGDGKVTPYTPWATDDGNDAQCYDPEEDETTGIQVSGTSAEFPDGQARLRYRLIPARTMAEHNPAPIEVDGDALSLKPGRINALGFACYDRIIDDNIFSFDVKKGVRYVAMTYDAATNVLIRVYDKDGKILVESTRSGDDTPNARAGFTASADATYYVGVAQFLEDDDLDDVFDQTVRFTVETVKPTAGDPDEWDCADDERSGASLLAPVPCQDWGIRTPEDMDPGHGWHRLGKHDWYDTFALCCRAGITYTLSTTLESADVRPSTHLDVSVFYMNGKSESSVRTYGSIIPASVDPFHEPFTFTAKENAVYYLRISVREGHALDYPAFKLHVMASDQGFPWDAIGHGLNLAAMKVTAKGNPAATWSLNSEKVAYPNGATIVLPLETYDEKTEKYKSLSYTVKYSKLKGFNKPADVKPSLKAWADPTEVVGAYTDTFDPKDDQPSGKGTVGGKSVSYSATSWSVKAKESTNARTFWSDDPADNFAITGKDGTYFDFSLKQQSEADDGSDPDAVFSIKNGNETIVADKTSVSKLHLPTSKAKYILSVTHRDAKNPVDTSYSISGLSADVGAIKFAKNAVTVKENAAYVTLTVNRTGKAGRLKVAYTTVDGTAKAAASSTPHKDDEKYYKQSDTLVWENGDNKAKTITIKLIPDIVGYYHGTDRSFSVVLSDAGDPGVDGEYPAKFPAGDTATVTLANSQTKKANDTIASAYKEIKAKSVKTEESSLRVGSYFGVAQATLLGEKLTNGFPQVASVSVTVASKKGADSISAKVQVAGKAYAFKSDSKTPVEWQDAGGGMKSTTLKAELKVGKASYENTLTLTVLDGDTTDADAWKTSGGSAVLEMYIPDAKGSGCQGPVKYTGEVYRDNSKIDDFLKTVVNFVGYYTVALSPFSISEGGAVEPGNLPAGNGYITVTVDNGGKAKGAGMLADGTKVSLAATAAGIVADAGSSTGYAMYIPVYAAKSPYCFGGLLKFIATDDTNGDGRKTVVVDAGGSELSWFNDNVALSASGEDAIAYDLEPVGGFYDTVERLQRHYFDRDEKGFAIDTVGVDELPDALFTVGKVTYTQRVAVQQADGFAVDLAVDAFATAKKVLAKDATKKKTDFEASVNPANVQVKVARATGLVSGSFSVWAESVAGAEKEITGAKHYGVVLMTSAELPPEGIGDIGADTVSAGFFNVPVNLPSGAKTRKWTYAAPFNIKGKTE